MRCILLRLAAAAVFLTPCIPVHGQSQPPGDFNVRSYGAVADGTSDDTAAIQKAMDTCAAQGGGVVTLPAGKYLIKTHLNIPPAVTLEGVWRAAPTVQKYHRVEGDPASGPELTGTVLLAVEGAGRDDGTPFITLNTNSTLKGVTIFYPDQKKTDPPVPYPWTIASAGADNISIVDVLLVNPYQAVDFGNRTSGRHSICNLYGQPLRKGLFVDLCLDVGRLENIHFWPFWTAADGQDSPVAKYMLEHGEAFIFGRSDWEYVSNCFALGYRVGMKFVRSHQGGPFEGGGNYLLTQSGADLCDIAVLVEEVQGHSGVSFSNSQIFGDIIVKETNNGMVRFTGCGLFGTIKASNGTGLARIAGRGRVSFSNCHFYAIYRAFHAPYLIHVAERGRISITGSLFINDWDAPYNRTPIVLEAGVRSAVITGNEFYGPAEIVDRTRGAAIIRDNLFETETHPPAAASSPGQDAQ